MTGFDLGPMFEQLRRQREELARTLASVTPQINANLAFAATAFHDLPKIIAPQVPVGGIPTPALDSLYSGLHAAYDTWATTFQQNVGDLAQQITSAAELGRALAGAWERQLPSNWRKDHIDSMPALAEIANEGIPVAWVPRVELVDALLEASSTDERISLLMHRSDEVIEDCEQALRECDHPDLADRHPLALESIAAFQHQLYGVAQAGAVNVLDGLIRFGADQQIIPNDPSAGRFKYERIASATQIDLEEVGIFELRWRTALAPIFRFFTTWSPGDPVLEHLSRHTSVHFATTGPQGSYSPRYAVTALLMLCSLFREWHRQLPREAAA